ncbi:hypothetical protein M0D21_21215 [Aquimarina sp. D1M17]|uniref:hypothetical protein n=1 Tax=Aquimarina acroporae TaxID=2937283 RepID=UPI0020BE05AD|nr:hypothetical protein [Aquimarina acroporae]MCK8524111.1 hypothetical protein [Aquimarina acroporae]
MITSYDFGYCRAEVYNDHVIVYINNGVTVSPENISELNFVTKKHFENKLYIYITVRVNSYTVDPMIYLESNKIENLLGFAIVSKDSKQISQVKIEKVFTNKKIKQFRTLKKALQWKDKIIKKHVS